MTDSRNPDRLIQAFLDEGVEDLSDRVYDLVRDQLHHNRQRVVIGPWRMPLMSTSVRAALAAAAVIVIALLGFTFLTRPSNTGQPGASSSPGASFRLLSNQGSIETSAILAPGTYLLADPFPVHMALTVPQAWQVWHLDFTSAGLLAYTGQGSGSGWGLFFLSPGDKLYANPCDKTRGMLDAPGPTVDDLVSALASLPGMTASTPVDIEVDGHAGKLIELTAPSDAASCAPGAATLWDFAGQEDYPMALGERLPVRIVDVDGVRLVIVATDYPGTSAWEQGEGATFDPSAHAEHQVELQAILDSIAINP